MQSTHSIVMFIITPGSGLQIQILRCLYKHLSTINNGMQVRKVSKPFWLCSLSMFPDRAHTLWHQEQNLEFSQAKNTRERVGLGYIKARTQIFIKSPRRSFINVRSSSSPDPSLRSGPNFFGFLINWLTFLCKPLIPFQRWFTNCDTYPWMDKNSSSFGIPVKKLIQYSHAKFLRWPH